MRHALKPHPDSACGAALGIEAEIERGSDGAVRLHFVVTGAVAGLSFPAAATPARTDGLWRHTCFELFVRPATGAGYVEINLSPSGEWAAYRFDGYRSGMSDLALAPPRIETDTQGDRYELRTALALGGAAGLPADAAWQIGLSAVIEESGGRKSYWALAHPPGKADFHHPDSFALQLPAAP